MAENPILTLEEGKYLQENKGTFQAAILLQLARQKGWSLNEAFDYYQNQMNKNDMGYSDYVKAFEKASHFLKEHAEYFKISIEEI